MIIEEAFKNYREHGFPRYDRSPCTPMVGRLCL